MLKFIVLLLGLLAAMTSSLGLEAQENHDAFVKADASTFACDGNSYKCKVRLVFGANNYWADWNVRVSTNPPN